MKIGGKYVHKLATSVFSSQVQWKFREKTQKFQKNDFALFPREHPNRSAILQFTMQLFKFRVSRWINRQSFTWWRRAPPRCSLSSFSSSSTATTSKTASASSSNSPSRIRPSFKKCNDRKCWKSTVSLGHKYSQLSLIDSAKITIMLVFSRNMAWLTKF